MKKYTIARFTNSGIGDHISCVLGAWHYSYLTGRTLVIDWRGSRFNPSPGTNCFFRFFEKVNEVAGVPVVADSQPSWIPEKSQIYPTKWTPENLAGFDHIPHDAEEITQMNALMMSGEDRPEQAVIVNQYINLSSARIDLSSALNDLTYHREFTRAADMFIEKILPGQPLIGLHLRHGNGENIFGRSAFWLDPLAFAIQRYRDFSSDIHNSGPDGQPRGRFRDNAVESLTARQQRSRTETRLYQESSQKISKLAQNLGIENYGVLLFTDASRVIEGMREIVPNLIVYPKKMFEKGEGPLHQMQLSTEESEITSGVFPDVVKQMMVELSLLRRCEGIVCIPSNFSETLRTELPAQNCFILRPPVINRMIEKLVRKLVS